MRPLTLLVMVVALAACNSTKSSKSPSFRPAPTAEPTTAPAEPTAPEPATEAATEPAPATGSVRAYLDTFPPMAK